MMGSALNAQLFSSWEGQMIALSSSGNRVAFVGAGCSGKSDDGSKRTLVGIFDWRGDQWEKVGSLNWCNSGVGSETVPEDYVRATWSVGSSWNYGHVIIYDWKGFQWIQVSPSLSADDGVFGDEFVETVALSSDGTRLVIGAPFVGDQAAGRVRIYDELSVLQQEDPSSQ